MTRKQLLAGIFAVLFGLTYADVSYAAQSDEILVAMASFKTVCGGNTGRACPGQGPVAAPPVTPAPKPSPAPIPSSPSPSAPVSPSVSTPTPSNVTGSSIAVDHTSTATDDAHAIMPGRIL